MRFLISYISMGAREIGVGDRMENHKPSNSTNMGGWCAYAGVGVLVVESTSCSQATLRQTMDVNGILCVNDNEKAMDQM